MNNYVGICAGCSLVAQSLGHGWRMTINADLNESIVNPLSMLKNPMILIGVLGLAFVIGVPYLLDNSTSPIP